MSARIEIRLTVEAVTTVGVTLKPAPCADGDDPISPTDGNGSVWFALPLVGDEPDKTVARAFGSVLGIEGAVRMLVEPVAPTEGP